MNICEALTSIFAIVCLTVVLSLATSCENERLKNTPHLDQCLKKLMNVNF